MMALGPYQMVLTGVAYVCICVFKVNASHSLYSSNFKQKAVLFINLSDFINKKIPRYAYVWVLVDCYGQYLFF